MKNSLVGKPAFFLFHCLFVLIGMLFAYETAGFVEQGEDHPNQYTVSYLDTAHVFQDDVKSVQDMMTEAFKCSDSSAVHLMCYEGKVALPDKCSKDAFAPFLKLAPFLRRGLFEKPKNKNSSVADGPEADGENDSDSHKEIEVSKTVKIHRMRHNGTLVDQNAQEYYIVKFDKTTKVPTSERFITELTTDDDVPDVVQRFSGAAAFFPQKEGANNNMPNALVFLFSNWRELLNTVAVRPKWGMRLACSEGVIGKDTKQAVKIIRSLNVTSSNPSQQLQRKENLVDVDQFNLKVGTEELVEVRIRPAVFTNKSSQSGSSKKEDGASKNPETMFTRNLITGNDFFRFRLTKEAKRPVKRKRKSDELGSDDDDESNVTEKLGEQSASRDVRGAAEKTMSVLWHIRDFLYDLDNDEQRNKISSKFRPFLDVEIKDQQQCQRLNGLLIDFLQKENKNKDPQKQRLFIRSWLWQTHGTNLEFSVDQEAWSKSIFDAMGGLAVKGEFPKNILYQDIFIRKSSSQSVNQSIESEKIGQVLYSLPMEDKGQFCRYERYRWYRVDESRFEAIKESLRNPSIKGDMSEGVLIPYSYAHATDKKEVPAKDGNGKKKTVEGDYKEFAYNKAVVEAAQKSGLRAYLIDRVNITLGSGGGHKFEFGDILTHDPATGKVNIIHVKRAGAGIDHHRTQVERCAEYLASNFNKSKGSNVVVDGYFNRLFLSCKIPFPTQTDLRDYKSLSEGKKKEPKKAEKKEAYKRNLPKAKAALEAMRGLFDDKALNWKSLEKCPKLREQLMDWLGYIAYAHSKKISVKQIQEYIDGLGQAFALGADLFKGGVLKNKGNITITFAAVDDRSIEEILKAEKLEKSTKTQAEIKEMKKQAAEEDRKGKWTKKRDAFFKHQELWGLDSTCSMVRAMGFDFKIVVVNEETDEDDNSKLVWDAFGNVVHVSEPEDVVYGAKYIDKMYVDAKLTKPAESMYGKLFEKTERGSRVSWKGYLKQIFSQSDVGGAYAPLGVMRVELQESPGFYECKHQKYSELAALADALHAQVEKMEKPKKKITVFNAKIEKMVEDHLRAYQEYIEKEKKQTPKVKKEDVQEKPNTLGLVQEESSDEQESVSDSIASSSTDAIGGEWYTTDKISSILYETFKDACDESEDFAGDDPSHQGTIYKKGRKLFYHPMGVHRIDYGNSKKIKKASEKEMLTDKQRALNDVVKVLRERLDINDGHIGEVIVPLHFGAHWVTLHIDIDSKKVTEYDSMPSAADSGIDEIQNFISNLFRSVKFEVSRELPRVQQDGSSCGVITVENIKDLFEGLDLAGKKQEIIPSGAQELRQLHARLIMHND